MSSLYDITVPLSLEPEKSQARTVKPDFEPSPDIFHRSYAHNPSVKVRVPETDTFSVVSYNILAECHRQRGDYSYTEEGFLEQEYRHQLLLRELQYLDADVVCLQEVNPQYYKTVLEPALSKIGFTGTFIKRKGEYFDEGGATFVRTSRFDMEFWEGIYLSDAMISKINRLTLSPDIKESLLQYTQWVDVVNICRLRCKKTSQVVVIGNLHAVWDDHIRPDVKSLQIATAVNEVVRLAGSDSYPHILCGDFNSVPTSVGYQLAQDGYLSDSNIATLQGVENLKLQSRLSSMMRYMPESFKHSSCNLRSAYQTCQGAEPEVTCYTNTSWGCLDYILYSTEGLSAVHILRVVDKESLEATEGLPNRQFPSDHLSIKATFNFKSAFS